MPSIHDPAFAPPEEPPFAPLRSPFRQKGHGYLGDFTYFDRAVPGGSVAVIAAVPSTIARAYLQQPFRGSEWYDAYPCAIMHAAAARLSHQTLAQLRRAVGAYHAATAGVLYRALLRVVSNEAVALWAPRIASIYFEYGKVLTVADGPSRVTGEWRGIPASLAQFTVFAAEGFTEEMLRVAGASAPRFELATAEPDGEKDGQPLVRIPLRIAWS